MGVPAAELDLHEADARFDEPARQETARAEPILAVLLQHVRLLVSQVQGARERGIRHLPAQGQERLPAIDRLAGAIRGEVRVQALDEVEAVLDGPVQALHQLVGAGGIQDGKRSDFGPEKARIAGPADRPRRPDGDEGRDPGRPSLLEGDERAERGMDDAPRRRESRAQQIGPAIVIVFRTHDRAEDRHAVGPLRGARKQRAEPDPGSRRRDGPDRTAGFPAGSGIEGVDLARPAVHPEHDHGLGRPLRGPESVGAVPKREAEKPSGAGGQESAAIHIGLPNG